MDSSDVSQILKSLSTALNEHQELVERLLAVVEAESRGFVDGQQSVSGGAAEAKRRLLPQVDASVRRLRAEREAWLRIPAEERQKRPEAAHQMQRVQDLLMKVILRDRENEQVLLQQGRVPAGQMARVQPPARSHFVSELYKRNQTTSPS
ncbi:MAG: hypothetical protein FJ405_10210 [Verrucomicrobia bacterium]|nr:hypothetical protein [Verrucomicrobiota bacterium]